MGINRGFDLSAGVITTETDDATGESVVLLDTYDVSASVSTGPAEGSSDGMGAALYADATAIGEDTFASVSADATVTDGPIATSTEVSLTTHAAAVSADQSYAWASGSVDLIGGADWSFSLSYDSSITDQEVDGTTSKASSIDYLYAIDFDDSGAAAPPPSVEFTDDGVPVVQADEALAEPAYDDPCGCGGDGSISFAGNVAIFDIEMDVLADDGVVEVDLYSLAVEDQMSTVTLASVVIAG